MKISPSFTDFENNYTSGKTQLVWGTHSADLETPVSAYLKVSGGQDYSFLLESIEGGKTLGRYSIIGLDPDVIWSCEDGKVSVRGVELSDEQCRASTLESLRNFIAMTHIDVIPSSLPPMASSGMFGYIGYDMVRLVEDIPDENIDDLGIPDGTLIRPKALIIFDNVKSIYCIAAAIYTHADNSSITAKDAYQRASDIISGLQEKLLAPLPANATNNKTKLSAPLEVSSNTSRDEYHAMVKKAVEYIHAGEIFQVVPSQRFSMKFDLPSIELYRSLRRLNPSPFMFHLSFKDFSLVGSSPEILVRVRDDVVTIRPIAGTRKRGKSDAEDKELIADLLADPKERAEHLMLLDLGRNDIGRVAEIGSVDVTAQFTIELYSHVMHIVSNVEGILKDGLDTIDALFAGFPAGTVSGAPKIRAMQIIDELEKTRRSYYGGGVGYFSGNGVMDSCIALRTALVKDGTIYVQAGGGVVADSDPEFEYQETRNKARAIIAAAEMAIDISCS